MTLHILHRYIFNAGNWNMHTWECLETELDLLFTLTKRFPLWYNRPRKKSTIYCQWYVYKFWQFLIIESFAYLFPRFETTFAIRDHICEKRYLVLLIELSWSQFDYVCSVKYRLYDILYTFGCIHYREW